MPNLSPFQRTVLAAACVLMALGPGLPAESDLDALMSRVLDRRDENWKKLQQYTLNERQRLQVTALAVLRVYGFEREYLWYPREGFFIRSPLRADGVAIGEAERRAAEERWLQRSRERERSAAEKKGDAPAPLSPAEATERPAEVGDIIRQSFEPEFIQAAMFLKFPFEPGQYAFVERERMLDRDVLRIEYYPTRLFRDDPPDGEAPGDGDRDDGEWFAERMNKVSLVTLWIDPLEHQILRYEFRNIDMDFLPAKWLVRIDGMQATMQMDEPFPSVWLPASIAMRFRMRLATGPIEGRYEIRYTDYRLPEATGRIVE